MTLREHYDVVIMGGGLAGLTLARQLKLARPQTSVLVAEQRQHPVPEAAHKVGESTVELGAHYLSEVLGMGPHLTAAQLPKLGLRFFFRAGDNRDIARRVEVGPSRFPLVPSYQLDRGRFENVLGRENLQLGVEFLDACKVQQVTLQRSQHAVTLLNGTNATRIVARWVVDATGYVGHLKRQLGLVKTVSHDVNAVWFRIADRIALDDWSQEAQWLARVPSHLRQLSTNHLMGRGYWVWLIPLASSSTSIGIVADPALHPFEQINRFERAMAWLWEREPQCAQAIEEKRALLQDFRVLKHYAHSCERVFSADRWGITGIAGVFLDPFYSPGTDFIALSNTFLTDLIVRELQGEAIAERAELYNRTFLNAFEQLLLIFEGQYPLMGNAQVMAAKAVWDFATYWGIPALLYFHQKFCDLHFMSSVVYELWRFNQLNARMQTFFREWDKLERSAWSDIFVDYDSIDFLNALHCGMIAGLSDDELRAKLVKNIELCETIATEMFRKAVQLLSVFFEKEAINPYAISLEPERWRADGLFANSGKRAPSPGVAAELNKIWFDRNARTGNGAYD